MQPRAVLHVIEGWTLLCFGVCPMHCRTGSSAPDCSPLELVTPPYQVVTTKNVSRHCKILPGRSIIFFIEGANSL
jgi:hypothetical protein